MEGQSHFIEPETLLPFAHLLYVPSRRKRSRKAQGVGLVAESASKPEGTQNLLSGRLQAPSLQARF